MYDKNIQDKLISSPNGLMILENRLLAESRLVIHGTSTRMGGFSRDEYNSLNMGYSTGDEEKSVQKNRLKFFHYLQIQSDAVIYAQQIHSNHIALIDENLINLLAGKKPYQIPQTDAMITRFRNIPLAVLTADCQPIFILDELTPAIGLIHAGWRGTKSEIAFHTLELMKNSFGTKPENCIIWLSAAIGQCCYQIDEILQMEFKQQYHNQIQPVIGDKLDLTGINRYQFMRSGVPENRIYQSQYCTCHDENLFYSYRRSGKKSGRLLSLFMLKNKTI